MEPAPLISPPGRNRDGAPVLIANEYRGNGPGCQEAPFAFCPSVSQPFIGPLQPKQPDRLFRNSIAVDEPGAEMTVKGIVSNKAAPLGIKFPGSAAC